MIILYLGMKYDYGKPEQGLSFEHYNMFECLRHMGLDILYFDFMTLLQERGRDWMNARLVEIVKAEKPDLTFVMLFGDEFEPDVMRRISESGDTVTFNWFADDHWRFNDYSCHWAPCFNWVSTTAQSALPKYAKMGYQNVIKTQWACNPFLYRRLEPETTYDYDVTFVGQPHGDRRQVIQTLRDAGVTVQAWGTGWESGRVSQDQMIRVFNRSRINLNLTNSSQPLLLTPTAAQRLRGRLSRMATAVPYGTELKTLTKQALKAARRGNAGSMIHQTSPMRKGDRPSYSEQIKGRNFEVPGCSGFLLTGAAENLNQYYQDGTEVVCFDGTADLVEKTLYYLREETERVSIAHAGYTRTLNEHTYIHRFTEIFRHMGLPTSPVESILRRQVSPGQVKEICA